MVSNLLKKISASEDWELWGCEENSELPEVLSEVALILKGGQKYSEIRIIPSEDALNGTEDWVFQNYSHLIYGKLTETEIERRKQGEPVLRMGPYVPIYSRDEEGNVDRRYSKEIDLGRYGF